LELFVKVGIQSKFRAIGLWALVAILPGCGLFGWLDRSEDYQESRAVAPLEVPPDLSAPVDDRSMSVPETRRQAGIAPNQASKPPDLDNSPLPEVADVDLPRDESEIPYLGLADTVESAWRRTGLALERTGFTIDSRDEERRLYAVRYAPPRKQEKKGGFFSWLFGRDDEADSGGGELYRVSVVGAGESESRVMVLDASGQPQSGETAERILSLLAQRLMT
jgi:uncharacterized lipoprotein